MGTVTGTRPCPPSGTETIFNNLGDEQATILDKLKMKKTLSEQKKWKYRKHR